jgi:uncharacterized heparinase superfamily protein
MRYLIERMFQPAALSSPPQFPKGASSSSIWDSSFPSIPLFHRPGPVGSEAVKNLARGEFEHLNRGFKIGRPKSDWQLGPQSANRLWTNTLHYHYWAYDLAEAVQRQDEQSDLAADLLKGYISDWIGTCDLRAPGARDLAWNTFAVATRLGWWTRAFLALGPERLGAWPEFEEIFLRSLFKQAAYLHNHLEWDLRGNHLMRDAVGLAWAGRLFRGPEAENWLQTATHLAAEQVDEQVLPDGGHFERSPMYHIHIMEDVLSLALLLKDPAVCTNMRNTWSKMAEYLAWMRHPDDRIPLFNDAALGAVCHPQDMLAFGERIGVQVDAKPRSGGRYFADTGMIAWHGKPWALFFDVGPVGPDYQPGHAHADTLSIECSFDEKRLFVDPGTHSYDNDGRREYDRSTQAHNTVCIDREDSSEVWHIFRVGRRARPLEVSIDLSAENMTASASHNGYDHLPGRPRHVRTITLNDHGSLAITDRIQGKGVHLVQGGLLIAPEWKAHARPGGWELRSGSSRVRASVSGPENLRLFSEPRPYHPEYGLELEATRLAFRIETFIPVKVQTVIEAD